MAPFKGVDTWIQAVSGYWPRLVFWESYQKESKPGRVGRGLLYTEDEVMKSLDMASKALHHKNHVIHALQLKILAMEEGMPLSDRPIEEAKTIKAWQGEGAILDGIHGGIENEDGNETLNALRIQLAKANEALIQSRLEIQEKEETIQELAHMLASREASQMALIETVQSYIAQQCVIPSLPATPTNATTAIGGTGIENWDADATQSQLEIIIERLHAQAEIGTKKLREVGLHEQGTHYET